MSYICAEHQKELHDCMTQSRIKELKASLAEANKQSNHFETEWQMTLDVVTSLEAKLAKYKLDPVHIDDSHLCVPHEMEKLIASRDKWRGVAEKMAEKFNYIKDIGYMDEAEGPELRAQNANLFRLSLESIKAYDSALRSESTTPDTTHGAELYSGQCNHQIPIGQHCNECKR